MDATSRSLGSLYARPGRGVLRACNVGICEMNGACDTHRTVWAHVRATEVSISQLDHARSYAKILSRIANASLSSGSRIVLMMESRLREFLQFVTMVMEWNNASSALHLRSESKPARKN